MPNNSPGDVMMMSPHPTTPPSERTRSPSLTSPAAAHKFLFPPSVSEPWNRQIPKAFREKVVCALFKFGIRLLAGFFKDSIEISRTPS